LLPGSPGSACWLGDDQFPLLNQLRSLGSRRPLHAIERHSITHLLATAFIAGLLVLKDAPDDALLDQVEAIDERATRPMLVRPA
jgi:hypothetical protein